MAPRKSKDSKEQPPANHPFRAVKRAGVPIVCYETPDPQSTIVACQKARNGKPEAWLAWDCTHGLRAISPRNPEADAIVSAVGDPTETMNLTSCLTLIYDKYERTDEAPAATFFVHSGHEALADWTCVQAIWNLRDKLKSIGSTLVLLGPAFRVPPYLKHDAIVISEPLPDEAELWRRTESICKDAKLTELPEEEKTVDTIRGLSAFGAEQVLAMSIEASENGPRLNMQRLWDRKVKMIEQTPGLTVWRGGETFDQIGGCDSVKAYLRDYMTGPARMRAVVWIDEIEKSLAGAGGGDLSGVSSDYLGQLLTYMQDSGARGMIFVGPPGAAKSAIAKCAGNEANVPTIALDLGGMKGSLVGQSEQQLRGALKVIDAISDGKALWIATCNSLAVLPPELRRRFALGLWFFDLPDAAEREAIWQIYAAKYEGVKADITSADLPGWTGAEIKALFDTAWSTGRSLKRASRIIVPVCKQAKDKIEALRRAAAGNFTCAGKEGIYTMPEVVEVTQGRRMES